MLRYGKGLDKADGSPQPEAALAAPAGSAKLLRHAADLLEEDAACLRRGRGKKPIAADDLEAWESWDDMMRTAIALRLMAAKPTTEREIPKRRFYHKTGFGDNTAYLECLLVVPAETRLVRRDGTSKDVTHAYPLEKCVRQVAQGVWYESAPNAPAHRPAREQE